MHLWHLLSAKLRGCPMYAASLLVTDTLAEWLQTLPACPRLQYAAARVGAVLVNLNPSLKAAGAHWYLNQSNLLGTVQRLAAVLDALTHACSPGRACGACCC